MEPVESMHRSLGSAAGSPPGPALSAHRVANCVWPVNCLNPCRRVASQGRTCLEHMTVVRRHAGTLDCAWPGCIWRAWDRRGLCLFHWKVAFGLIND